MYDYAMDDAFHIHFWYERLVGKKDAAKVG
jgi:hypothetical protein